MTSPGEKLLLLAPSSGFGGGIERLSTAVERNWCGRVRRVDLYRHGHVAQPTASPMTKAMFACRALQAAREERPDIVCALHLGLLPVGAAVAKLSRSRLAMFGIGTEVWDDLTATQRALVDRCQHLPSISHFTRDVLAVRASIDPARITVVPLPVDERILALAAAAGDGSSSGKSEPVILTVSRVVAAHRFKGHRAVADALAVLLEDVPALRWHVVGEGDDLAGLQRYCEDLGVSHAVVFEGRISDERLTDLYQRSLVHVLPSVADIEARPPDGEGFGLVYAEAAAFGVASIASVAGGGALDFVEDGVTGITVPVGDTPALAGTIRLLLEDPRLRGKLGTAARERVYARHLPQHFALALRAALSVA